MSQHEKQEAVHKGQLEQLLVFNVGSTLSNSFLVFVLAYMLSEALPLTAISSWMICILSLNLIQFFVSQHFLRNPTSNPHFVQRRLNIIRLGILSRAIAWGSIILIAHGDLHVKHEIFIAYMFIGLSAGAAMVYSIDMVSALAFIVLAVVPLVISYAFGDNLTTIVISITGAFYVFFMSVSVRTFNQRLIEGLVLRQEAVNNAEEIKQLAFFDTLTGLPNRRLLLDRFKLSLLSVQRTGKRGAVLFLDLDNFKKLNDSLGHHMGDELLMQVSERLQQSVRETDTVSRFGGDEFVVMLENLNDDYQTALEEVNRIARLIHRNLNQPYQLANNEYITTSSMGIALYGEHGNTPEELLKSADAAMYQAKNGGRNAVRVYNLDTQP